MTQSTNYSLVTPKPRIGLAGAIAIGLASMLGAGAFVVYAYVAEVAGSLQFVSIAIATMLASVNAASIYQLAKAESRPGGVYSFARKYVSDHASFVAGFAFSLGKIGSIAAIALIFENYIFPDAGNLAAILSVLLLVGINILGINRTAQVAAVLAIITSVFLCFAIGSAFTSPSQQAPDYLTAEPGNPLTGAALMFFAFAGYARVATLGDEVRKPKESIPRAILVSLSLVAVIYLFSAVALNTVLGDRLADSDAPFLDLLTITAPWFPRWAVAMVASLAALGSMLALLAGTSRTMASMAEDNELPNILSRRNRFGSPWIAELAIAFIAIAMVQFFEAVWVIGFSSFSVLLYYAIGHWSSFCQPAAERFMPRWINGLAILLCGALMLCVPGPAIPVSTVVILAAVAVRKLVR